MENFFWYPKNTQKLHQMHENGYKMDENRSQMHENGYRMHEKGYKMDEKWGPKKFLEYQKIFPLMENFFRDGKKFFLTEKISSLWKFECRNIFL